MANKMPWFRFYSEVLNDRKIQRACRMAQQPKAVLVGVWTTLLCLANDSPERGKLMFAEDMWLTEDEIQAETGLDPVTFGKIIKVFQQLDMLSIGAGFEVTHWEDRQFDSDNSTARVRRYRARKRKEKAKNDAAKEPEPATKRGETFQERFRNVIDTEEEKDTDKSIHARMRGGFALEVDNGLNGTEQRNRMVTAIANVVKETLTPENQDRFNDVAEGFIANDIALGQVDSFGHWWKENGYYSGRPAIKTLTQEIKNSIDGVSVHASTNGAHEPVYQADPLTGAY